MRFLTFHNFLNEKAGVPPAIIPYAEDLAQKIFGKIKEELQKEEDPTDLFTKMLNQMVGKIGADFGTSVDFKYSTPLNDDFPVVEVKGNLELFKVHGLEKTQVEGSYAGADELKSDKKKNFHITVNVKLYVKSEFSIDEKSKEEVIEALEGLYYHELLHAYEDMHRFTKRPTKQIVDTEDQIYAAASSAIRNNNRLPDVLSEFLYLVYASASFEVAARNSQMWPEIKKTADPREREKIIKQSESWKLATMLTDFDAEKMMDGIREDVKRNNREVLRKQDKITPEDAMKSVVRLFKETFSKVGKDLGEVSMQKLLRREKKSPLPENLADVEKNIRKHQADVSSLSNNPSTFFKKWEGKFHREGEIAKRKLLKMTTAEM